MPATPPFERLQRYLVPALAALTLLILAQAVVTALLWLRLADTRDDLTRVEGGAALYAARVEAFEAFLTDAGPAVAAQLDGAIAGLETFRSSTLEFTVSLDDTIDVQADILIDRDLTFPIDTTIPIDQTIDTTIQVTGPLGVAIPVDVTVPIRLDLPVQLDVTVPLNETLPINATVPIHLDAPVTLDVGDTDLALFAEALAEGLAAFRDALSTFDTAN
jgi:hypothetical protein